MGQVLIGRKELSNRLNVGARLASMGGAIEGREKVIDSVERLLDDAAKDEVRIRNQLEDLNLQILALSGESAEQPTDEALDSRLSEVYDPKPVNMVEEAFIAQWEAAAKALEDASSVIEAPENASLGAREAVEKNIKLASDAYNDLIDNLASAKQLSRPTLASARQACTPSGSTMDFLSAAAVEGSLLKFERSVDALRVSIYDLTKQMNWVDATQLRGLLPDTSLARNKNALGIGFNGLKSTFMEFVREGEGALDRVCGVSAVRERYEFEKKLLEQQARDASAQRERVRLFADEMVGNLVSQATDSERYVLELLLDTVELVRPPADVAMMVNPATEGVRAEQMIEAMDRWAKGASLRSQADKLLGGTYVPSPLMVQVASSGDFATASLFSAAGGIGDAIRFRAPARNDANQGSRGDLGMQAELVRRPAPQIASAVSHRICVKNELGQADSSKAAKKFSEAFVSALEAGRTSRQSGSFSYLAGSERVSVVPVALAESRLGDCDTEAKTIGFDSRQLWVMSSGSKFMPGHNDVFGEAIGGLLGALLSRSTTFTYTCSDDVPSTDQNSVCGAYQRVQDQRTRIAALADSVGDRKPENETTSAPLSVATEMQAR